MRVSHLHPRCSAFSSLSPFPLIARADPSHHHPKREPKESLRPDPSPRGIFPAEFDPMLKAQKSILEVFDHSPYPEIDLEIERSRESIRQPFLELEDDLTQSVNNYNS